MFVETITQPKDEWDVWNARIQMHSNPPVELAASVAWQTDDGMVTQVNVWDSPGAVSDFYVERVLPLVQAHGEPAHKPERHGEPVSVFLRQ